MADFASYSEKDTLTDTLTEILEAFNCLIPSLNNYDDNDDDGISPAKFDVIQFRGKLLQKKIYVRDLALLIMFFMLRGNNITDIMLTTDDVASLERTDSEQATKLRALKKRLNIKPKARNNQTVTLARIASCFPEAMAAILTQRPDMPGIVQLDEIRKASGDPNYPSIARQPAIVCFIPRRMEDTSGMLNVFLLPSMLLAEKINTHKDMWQRQDAASKLLTQKVFQTQAYNSVLFNEDERIKWAVKFGMIISKEELKPSAVWENAMKTAKEWLVNNYGSCY